MSGFIFPSAPYVAGRADWLGTANRVGTGPTMAAPPAGWTF
jgi:hypothetical protein